MDRRFTMLRGLWGGPWKTPNFVAKMRTHNSFYIIDFYVVQKILVWKFNIQHDPRLDPPPVIHASVGKSSQGWPGCPLENRREMKLCDSLDQVIKDMAVYFDGFLGSLSQQRARYQAMRHSRNPSERFAWWGTEACCLHPAQICSPWECTIFKVHPPASVSP